MKRIVDYVNELAHQLRNTPQCLVVEDDPDDRELMRNTLNKCGCEVFAVENVEQANKLIATKLKDNPTYPFDVAFVDLKLVGAPGSHVIQQMAALAPKVPVIVVTGYPHGDEIEAAARVGYFGLVVKPLERLTVETIFAHHRIPYARPVANVLKDAANPQPEPQLPT